jgi:hypothetical protein
VIRMRFLCIYFGGGVGVSVSLKVETLDERIAYFFALLGD